MSGRGVLRVVAGLYGRPGAALQAAGKAWGLLRAGGAGAVLRAARRKVAEPTLPVSDAAEAPAGPLPAVLLRPAPVPPWCTRLSVTAVIPTRGRQDLLAPCLDSMAATLPAAARLQVVVVNNGGGVAAPAGFPYPVALRPEHRPFNWSVYNNDAVADAGSDFLLFLNDDVRALHPGWLDAMLAAAREPATGPVGAVLLYADGRIQHAGIAVDEGGATFHEGKLEPGTGLVPGPDDPASRPAFAVTGACLLVATEAFRRLGGFEPALALSFNDVDFCLRAAAAGLGSRVALHARLVHLETRTRPLALDPREERLFRARLAGGAG